jgi:hypothetical protein
MLCNICAGYAGGRSGQNNHSPQGSGRCEEGGFQAVFFRLKSVNLIRQPPEKLSDQK